MPFHPHDVVRHLKTQTDYTIVNTPACGVRIEATGEPAYMYRSAETLTMWVRAATEMEDGRFEKIGQDYPEAMPVQGFKLGLPGLVKIDVAPHGGEWKPLVYLGDALKHIHHLRQQLKKEEEESQCMANNLDAFEGHLTDLATLVNRFCRYVTRACGPAGEKLVADAQEYLKKNKLQGSPLRNEENQHADI